MSVAFGIDALGLDPHGVALPPAATSTDAVITPTTSLADIRGELVDAVNAVSPRKLARWGFRHTDSPVADFRDYAEQNESAVIREYAIEFTGWQPVSVYDLQLQRRSTEMEIVVAYPHHWATYKANYSGQIVNHAALEDAAEDDAALLLATLGFAGVDNYPAGAVPTSEEVDPIERADGVSFLVVRIGAEFIYDTRVS